MYNIKDNEYQNIIKDILQNNEFEKLHNIIHHGISRWEHLTKVSYRSYLIAKKLKIDYKSTARGGLLHDFYLDGNERNNITKFFDTFRHPKKVLTTYTQNFNINKKEKNIIISHMFPFYPAIPLYKESIIVNLVDKIIGGNELIKEYYHKIKNKSK